MDVLQFRPCFLLLRLRLGNPFDQVWAILFSGRRPQVQRDCSSRDAALLCLLHVLTSSCCVALFAARFAFLALMPSLVSCLLAPPSGNLCNLTLLADIQQINEKNPGAPAASSICPAHVRPPRFRLRAPLYINVSTLSPKIVVPVRRDCRSSKISYGDSLRWRLNSAYRSVQSVGKIIFPA